MVKSRVAEKILLSEECLAVAVSGTAYHDIITDASALSLLSAEPAKNMDVVQRIRLVEEAIGGLRNVEAYFTRLAEQRAKELLEDHRRVRRASDATGLRYDVKPCLPVDIIGIYVLMPSVAF